LADLLSGHPVPVVGHCDRRHATHLVGVEFHLDRLGVRVDSVPDELADRFPGARSQTLKERFVELDAEVH